MVYKVPKAVSRPEIHPRSLFWMTSVPTPLPFLQDDSYFSGQGSKSGVFYERFKRDATQRQWRQLVELKKGFQELNVPVSALNFKKCESFLIIR